MTALIAKIKTALPTWTVKTKLNDFNTSDNSAYPYIHISDIFQEEGGVKTYYNYTVECLINIVYKDITDLSNLWDTQDTILGIFNHPAPFTLTGNFTIIDTMMIANTDVEVQIDTGKLNIGQIRVRFMIYDSN